MFVLIHFIDDKIDFKMKCSNQELNWCLHALLF